jgi:hypothetical protein
MMRVSLPSMRPPPFIRSSSAITEGFFVVAAVIAVSLVASSVIPGVALISNAFAGQAAQDKNKVDLQMTVIFAYGVPGATTVDVYIKNTGITSLSPLTIEQSTIFFGPTDAFQMLRYGGNSSDTPPYWTFSVVDDGVGISDNNSTAPGSFGPGQTMEVVITTAAPLSSGNYYFQITSYVGTSFDYTFSI